MAFLIGHACDPAGIDGRIIVQLVRLDIHEIADTDVRKPKLTLSRCRSILEGCVVHNGYKRAQQVEQAAIGVNFIDEAAERNVRLDFAFHLFSDEPALTIECAFDFDFKTQTDCIRRAAFKICFFCREDNLAFDLKQIRAFKDRDAAFDFQLFNVVVCGFVAAKVVQIIPFIFNPGRDECAVILEHRAFDFDLIAIGQNIAVLKIFQRSAGIAHRQAAQREGLRRFIQIADRAVKLIIAICIVRNFHIGGDQSPIRVIAP